MKKDDKKRQIYKDFRVRTVELKIVYSKHCEEFSTVYLCF